MLHITKKVYICSGEVAEWSIATVLKTVVPRGTGGSNPSFSAQRVERVLMFHKHFFIFRQLGKDTKKAGFCRLP